jgi:hypothetical protein
MADPNLCEEIMIPFVRAVMQESLISKQPACKRPLPMHSMLSLSQKAHVLLLGLFLIPKLRSLLSNNSLQLSLTGSLGLSTLGIHLLLKNSLTRLLGLGSVDLFPMLA